MEILVDMLLKKEIQYLKSSFEVISEERKKVLQDLVRRIQQIKQDEVNLVFVCTHNSRRSHLAQLWWKLALEEYNFSFLKTYSAGTETTRIHPNTLKVLMKQGFSVEDKFLDESLSEENPKVPLTYFENRSVECFSKTISDHSLPKKFIAIMTCGHAEVNCPFISQAEFRFPLTYEDPKISDGTSQMEQTYLERSRQIGREAFYALSLLK